MKRARLRRTAWIAIVAVLLNTLAPLVSNALAVQRAVNAHEHCDEMEGGGHAEHHAAAGHQAPQPHSDHLGHCPYCAPHAASFAAPPVASLDLVVGAATAVAPDPALDVARAAA